MDYREWEINVNCVKALSDKEENKIYFEQKYQFSSVKWLKKWTIIMCAIKKHSACVKLSVAPKKCQSFFDSLVIQICGLEMLFTLIQIDWNVSFPLFGCCLRLVLFVEKKFP